MDRAIESMTLAYEDYPMFNYFFGGSSKADAIKRVLKPSMPSEKCGRVVLTAGDGAAVAIFVGPEYKGVPALRFLFSGGWKLALRYSFGMFKRLLNYEDYAMRLKGKYSHENCWYLYSLTVHPEYQGGGLASKVLKPMLDFLDATNQSCYLETNKDSNADIYKHFGFEIMEKGTIPGTDVVHFAMRRDPRK